MTQIFIVRFWLHAINPFLVADLLLYLRTFVCKIEKYIVSTARKDIFKKENVPTDYVILSRYKSRPNKC